MVKWSVNIAWVSVIIKESVCYQLILCLVNVRLSNKVVDKGEWRRTVSLVIDILEIAVVDYQTLIKNIEPCFIASVALDSVKCDSLESISTLAWISQERNECLVDIFCTLKVAKILKVRISRWIVT